MTYPTSLDELTDGVPSDGAAPTTELDDATYPHDDHHRALAQTVEGVESVLGYGGTMPGDILFPEGIGFGVGGDPDQAGVGMVGFPFAGLRFGVMNPRDVSLYGPAGDAHVTILASDDSLDLYGAGGWSLSSPVGAVIGHIVNGMTITSPHITLNPGDDIVNVSTARITNVINPSGAQDAATKASQDAAVAAEAALARNGDNITSGTVADARIASTIARDSEVAAAYQPLDADLTDIAGIADAQGDIIVRGASGWERLAKSATSTDVLTAGASQPGWSAPAGGAVATDAIFDAKGDLPVGTGADTADNLAAGTNGLVLTADSAQTTGLKWTAAGLTGRLKRSGISFLGSPVSQNAAESNKAVVTGFPYYLPFFLSTDTPVDRVTFYVGAASASGVALLGLFSSNTNGTPNAKLFDWGTVTTVGTGYKSITIADTLPAGLTYVFFDFNQNFSCTGYPAGAAVPLEWLVGGFSPVNCYVQSRGYDGTIPATAGALAEQSTALPVVRFRVT